MKNKIIYLFVIIFCLIVTTAFGQIEVKQFKYKNTTVTANGETTTTVGSSSFGYIAEEVVEILPELVSLNSSNQPETVRYKLLSVLLLEELKKLKARIEVLEAG